MLLTFVVPTYNRARLVSRAIDSVLSQRNEFEHPFEIVVVDDGSTDTTHTVLGKYNGDPAVLLLRHPRNRGLGYARNLAISQARGEWCVLLDSDNALLPGVAKQLEQALLAQPESVGVLWAESVDYEGSSLVSHSFSGRLPGDDVLRNRLAGEHFSVVRARIAVQCAYPDLGTTHACEPAFWAAVSARCDFVVLRERLQFYETTGSDRFCAIDNRLKRASELAACYSRTATVVGERSPSYYWELRGKSAFYRAAAGSWRQGLVESMTLARGIRYHWRNVLVMGSCLAGPSMCRWLLRRSARS